MQSCNRTRYRQVFERLSDSTTGCTVAPVDEGEGVEEPSVPPKTNGGIAHPVYGDDQFNIVRLPDPAIAPKKEVGT